MTTSEVVMTEPKQSKLPTSVITEMNNPDFEGLPHYSEGTYLKGCRGPMCRQVGIHKSRYIRRTKAIADALETGRPFVSRKRKEDNPELTRIILAMVLAAYPKRKVTAPLASVCERDSVPIPEWVEVPALRDTVPVEIMEEWKAKRHEVILATLHVNRYGQPVTQADIEAQMNELEF